jgi:hypothetical protein
MHPGDYEALCSQPRLLTTKEASKYFLDRWGIRLAATTLTKLRCIGGGPVFHRIGRVRVAYPVSGLDAHAQSLISKPLRSTSEAA